MLYYCLQHAASGEKVNKVYKGTLCIISYNYIPIYNYFNTHFSFKKERNTAATSTWMNLKNCAKWKKLQRDTRCVFA